jgi:C-terminal processing protease CtpA/Prc
MPCRPRTHATARFTTAALAHLVFAGATIAQTPDAPQRLDDDERQAVVLRISELLEQRYVYPEVGEEAGADLIARLEAGEFDAVSDMETFAGLLTDALQGLSHDRHLRVRVRPPELAQVEREDPDQARAQAAARARERNYGFEKVERLEGNVGYVEMRYFDGSADAKPTAAAAMNFLANSDAIIFDMRRNGGGSPEMIRYVSSWFFGEPTHLNSLYWRAGERTQEFWTYEEIPGEQRPDVPIFVLTSNRTFSGAEEFSYNMLTQERATLIGEVTGGGANPGGTTAINEHFEVFIPVGAAVNPITGRNWEGVGVTPHIEVPADEAFDVALEKARAAAEEYRSKKSAPNR